MRSLKSKIKREHNFAAEDLLARFQDHLKYSRARHPAGATNFDKLASLSLAIRDLAVQRGLFDEIHRALTEWGDAYFHLADFRSYADAQQCAADLYRDQKAWGRKAALSVARMGCFFSDRTIHEYAREIWNLLPVPVNNS